MSLPSNLDWKNPAPTIILEEFDRSAALVKTLNSGIGT
jgi:hypothetical protein